MKYETKTKEEFGYEELMEELNIIDIMFKSCWSNDDIDMVAGELSPQQSAVLLKCNIITLYNSKYSMYYLNDKFTLKSPCGFRTPNYDRIVDALYEVVA